MRIHFEVADVTEAFPVLFAPEGVANFLTHFHWAHIAFGLIVVVRIQSGIEEVS